MEQKKAKLGLSARMVLGIIFTILGGIYAAVGGVLAALLWDEEVRMVGMMFVGFGILFLIPGILCLVFESRKKRRVNRILAAGRYVWGDVIDIVRNPNVQVNGRCLYHVMVCYTDMYGTKHIFKGPNQHLIRTLDLIGKKVKVYIEDESYKFYYVDTAGLMDNIVVH